MALETTAELVAQVQDSGGVPVVYGGQASFGFWSAPGRVIHQASGPVVVNDSSVEVVSGAFSVPFEQGAPISVDGTLYTIGQFMALEDGALTMIWLMDG